MPPSGMKLSCLLLTAAAGGIGRYRREEGGVGDAEADLLCPCCRPPGNVLEVLSTPRREAGFPWDSAHMRRVDADSAPSRHGGEDRPALRWSPTMRPKTLVRLARARRSAASARMRAGLDSRRGARIGVKKPPPLVPSILMATCERQALSDRLLGPSTVVAST